jgi:hypothetical protein
VSPEVEAAITQAAQDAGEDPAFALATAERESDGNPNAHASRTIYGLFQMSGPLREQYGVGDSSDPYTQARGWMRFIGDTRKDMAGRLGRAPTSEELYAGHYFGPGRAARMISGQIGPDTDVRDVFTPQELAANPNIGRAGTVGNLMSSVEGDMTRRMGNYGGNYQPSGPNFAAFGVSQKGDFGGTPGLTYKSTSPQPFDSAAFGLATRPAPEAPTTQDAGTTVPAEQEEPTAPNEEAAISPAMTKMASAPQTSPIPGVSSVPGQQPEAAAPLPQVPRGSNIQTPNRPNPGATPA